MSSQCCIFYKAFDKTGALGRHACGVGPDTSVCSQKDGICNVLILPSLNVVQRL